MMIENIENIENIKQIFSQYSVKTLDDAKNLPFEILDIPILAESYCRNNNLKTLYGITKIKDIYDLESRSKSRCCWSIHKYFNWIQDALLQYGLRFAMNDDDWKEWWMDKANLNSNFTEKERQLENAKNLLGKDMIDFLKRLLFRDFEELGCNFFNENSKQTELLNKVILLSADYMEFNHTNTVDEIREAFSVNKDENKVEYFEFNNVSELEEHFFPGSICKTQKTYKINALLFVVSAKNYDEGLKDAQKIIDEIDSCLSDKWTILFGIKEDENGKMPKIRMLAGFKIRL